MNLLVVQYDIAWHDKPANHAKVRALLEGRTEPGDLVVLPEMFSTGFSMDVARVEEGSLRPSEMFLAEVARALEVCIVGGVVQRQENRGLNQAVAYGPAGLLARYTKIHPFTFGNEGEHYAAGRDVVTFEWNGAIIAPFVCYDLRFPEIFRHAVRRGAEVMLVIANWPARRAIDWSTLLLARAIENQAYVAGVNRIGADPNTSYTGGSIIVDPRGNPVSAAGDLETCIGAVFHSEFIRTCRATFPAVRDMRSEFLGL